MAETTSVPSKVFVASLLPTWQLTFPIYDFLLVCLELFLIVKMGPADFADYDRDSVGCELMLDD